MKSLKMLLAGGFLIVLTACGGTKTTTAETQSTIDNQVNNRGRSNTEVTTNSTVSRNTNANATVSGRVIHTSRESTSRSTTTNNNRTTTTTNNQKDAAAIKTKTEKMYADLNMNDDQISRFEREWKNSTGSWTNQPMNNFERTEIQDRIMKEILNDGQFEKYQQWAIDNAE